METGPAIFHSDLTGVARALLETAAIIRPLETDGGSPLNGSLASVRPDAAMGDGRTNVDAMRGQVSAQWAGPMDERQLPEISLSAPEVETPTSETRLGNDRSKDRIVAESMIAEPIFAAHGHGAGDESAAEGHRAVADGHCAAGRWDGGAMAGANGQSNPDDMPSCRDSPFRGSLSGDGRFDPGRLVHDSESRDRSADPTPILSDDGSQSGPAIQSNAATLTAVDNAPGESLGLVVTTTYAATSPIASNVSQAGSFLVTTGPSAWNYPAAASSSVATPGGAIRAQRDLRLPYRAQREYRVPSLDSRPHARWTPLYRMQAGI